MPFEIVRNDITKMHVDAIVNPTNSNLFGTAGVDGIIHKMEGLWLREETAKFAPLEPGHCVVTKALKLPAGHIIHTIGPVWKDGRSGEADTLSSCYKNAMDLAKENGFSSIAFPLISSGSYGCPKETALNIAIRMIGEFLLFHEMTVYLVVYDKKSYQLSEDLYKSVNAYIDDHYMDQHRMSRQNRMQEQSANLHREEAIGATDSISLKPIKSKKALHDVMNHLEETFAEMLLRLIDERGLKDPQVYKQANVTKQTFSKIRNNSQYNPTKQTVLAFAIALKLSLDEAKDLLLKSGYALSKSNRFDVIMTYFFETENYDIYEINAVLFQYDENLLGL